MGLDITYNTRSKDGLPKVWSWDLKEVEDNFLGNKEFEDIANTKDAVDELKGSSIDASKEERAAASQEYAKQYHSLQDKVDKFNQKNGYVEMYFRKVPRMVFLGLAAKEIEEGWTPGSLLKYGNAMGEELDDLKHDRDLLYSGTIKLSTLKDLLENDAVLQKLKGARGFFWGNDENTTDEEILERFGEFVKNIEANDAALAKDKDGDVVIEYSFSW